MLIAVPKSWFSWDFTVMDGTRLVGDIDMSCWREKGVITVEGADYRVNREGLMSGDFVLASDDKVVARATKPSAFRRTFMVEHGGQQYTLRAQSALRRAFELLDGDTIVGTLSPRGLFTRRAAIDLPETMPLSLRVFIIWLAVIIWKREAESQGATTAGSA
jgi:hypothetical protein